MLAERGLVQHRLRIKLGSIAVDVFLISSMFAAFVEAAPNVRWSPYSAFFDPGVAWHTPEIEEPRTPTFAPQQTD